MSQNSRQYIYILQYCTDTRWCIDRVSSDAKLWWIYHHHPRLFFILQIKRTSSSKTGALRLPYRRTSKFKLPNKVCLFPNCYSSFWAFLVGVRNPKNNLRCWLFLSFLYKTPADNWVMGFVNKEHHALNKMSPKHLEAELGEAHIYRHSGSSSPWSEHHPVQCRLVWSNKFTKRLST